MENIFSEIKEERKSQNLKWGEQNHKPIEWMAILMEEVGEVAKEAHDHHFVVKDNSENYLDLQELQNKRLVNYREELIQVAAVAVQMIECLDRNMPTNRCAHPSINGIICTQCAVENYLKQQDEKHRTISRIRKPGVN